jgi:hypothetical protein
MKTIFNDTLKNNVQKTLLRSTAIVVSFILISFTVTAQGYWTHLLTNNSFTQIASSLVENPSGKAQGATPDRKPSRIYEGFELVKKETKTSLEVVKWVSVHWFFKPGSQGNNQYGME